MDRSVGPHDTRAAAPLRPMVMATRDLAPNDRFEAWRERYRTLNEVIVAPRQREAFAAHAEDWPLGEMLLSRASAPARRLVRTARDCAADDFDHWVLRVSRAGPMLCRSGDSTIRVEAGQLFVGAFDRPSTVDYPDGDWVALIVPRHVATRWGLDLGMAQRIGPKGAGAQVAADFLLSLADHMPAATTADVPRLGEALRGVLAAALPAGGEAVRLAPADVATRQRAVVDRIIRREIASARLNVSRLSQLSGLSRSTLYRLYEGEGGLAARIRHIRLDEVRAALADPAQARNTIGQVAEKWGFHCTTSFNRAFRSAFATTPGAVRARGAGVQDRTRSDFEEWLRRA